MKRFNYILRLFDSGHEFGDEDDKIKTMANKLCEMAGKLNTVKTMNLCISLQIAKSTKKVQTQCAERPVTTPADSNRVSAICMYVENSAVTVNIFS